MDGINFIAMLYFSKEKESQQLHAPTSLLKSRGHSYYTVAPTNEVAVVHYVRSHPEHEHSFDIQAYIIHRSLIITMYTLCNASIVFVKPSI